MADNIRSELVVDALQMAIWNRRPPPGTVHHSDHGSRGLHQLGLRPPALQHGPARVDGHHRRLLRQLRGRELLRDPETELLDRSTWPTREAMATAVFAFIEGFYNPLRRHSTLGYLGPADYETQHRSTAPAGPHADTAA